MTCSTEHECLLPIIPYGRKFCWKKLSSFCRLSLVHKTWFSGVLEYYLCNWHLQKFFSMESIKILLPPPAKISGYAVHMLCLSQFGTKMCMCLKTEALCVFHYFWSCQIPLFRKTGSQFAAERSTEDEGLWQARDTHFGLRQGYCHGWADEISARDCPVWEGQVRTSLDSAF